ncbi:hypothetical protein VTK73DRAFT_9433 [Phialemonium thermophilum]|uniref:Uncharacterized protein n=1 Tax=Phialemonium thermophilum TaxID=223376 RepID=A0ABR3XL74_9PEZI
MFSCFWDDTSKSTSGETGKETLIQDAPSSSEDGEKAPEKAPEATLFHRTGSGNQMPPEYRHSLLSAFLKLVAYDFGCNVSAPRTEPRLYVSSPTNHGGDGSATSLSRVPPRSSYFSSGCTFVFRTPTTREAARAGIVEGPVAAVSARHTFNFPPARQPSESPSAETDDSPVDSGTASSSDRDSVLDLARELVAALITAQHRAREGKTEKRIGQDAWWATKPRWGGGPGGPIGREVEMQSGADQTIGDKDVPPPSASASAETASDGVAAEGVSLNRISLPTNLRRPGPKRLKKSGNLPMYDNYRKLLPPGPTWDKKTKYTAIGRVPGADYDDIFVVSCLFHHVSVLRVRVPDRLLEVLQGASDEGIGQGTRSWGRLGVWRSKWYDLFQTEERIEAMQLIWSMMAYMMRRIEPSRAEGNVGDVRMQGT